MFKSFQRFFLFVYSSSDDPTNFDLVIVAPIRVIVITIFL